MHLDQAVPPDDGLDWVQLTNGEWMQGSLNGMRDGSLEFDSDEFDVHTVDFLDVKRLFLRTPVEIGLDDYTTLEGPLVLDSDKVIVQTADGPREVPRAKVLSIVAGTRELNYWSLDASLGVNLAHGNSNQGTGSAAAVIMREDSFTRLRLDYLWNFGQSNGVRNVNNQRGLAKLDLFVSHYFFLTPAQVTLEHDEFKNIKLRATPIAGGGVHIINTPKVEWDFSLGGGYQYTRYFSVATGTDTDVDNAAVSAGTMLDVEATDDLDLYFEYTNILVATDLGLTTHHLVGEIELEITTVFDFNLRFIFDRMEQPVTDEDGNTPKKNDYQLIAGIGIELG